MFWNLLAINESGKTIQLCRAVTCIVAQVWTSAQPITLFSRLPITSKHSFCPNLFSIPCEPPSLLVTKQAGGTEGEIN